VSSLAGRYKPSLAPMNSSGGKQELLFGCLPNRSTRRKIGSRHLGNRPDMSHHVGPPLDFLLCSAADLVSRRAIVVDER
jgi:hypothetical protein